MSAERGRIGYAMKKDFLEPILVLSLICLVVSGALALTYRLTEPVVANAAQRRTEEVRAEIIPDADGFESLDIEGLPPSISEVFKSSDGAGYIITVVTGGYGGDMKIILGINPDGMIIHSKVLEHSETKGLGSMIEEAWFTDKFIGLDKSRLGDVDAITGATISSRAYMKALSDAFEAFEAVTGRYPRT